MEVFSNESLNIENIAPYLKTWCAQKSIKMASILNL